VPDLQLRGLQLSEELSVRRDRPDELARIDVVELEARPLVQHVRVDLRGAQQRDALLAPGTLALELGKLAGQRHDLLVELLAGVEAVFARIGAEREITADRR